MTQEDGATPRGVPFMRTIGVSPPEKAQADATRVHLRWRKDLSNSAGVLHGGVLMSTLDYAMSLAARGTDAALSGVSTVDMRTSFLRAVDGDAMVSAQCIHRGTSLAFCEASARDDGGSVVATASATFRLFRTQGAKRSGSPPASQQESR